MLSRVLIVVVAWAAAVELLAQSSIGPPVLPPPTYPTDVRVAELPALVLPAPPLKPIADENTLELGQPVELSHEEDLVVPETVLVEPEEEKRWYQPVYWFGPTPWDSGLELGVNGATGSSESTSLRTGGFIKRKSERTKLDFSAYYNKTKSGGAETQNNAQFDIRNDWFNNNTRWTFFSTGSLFYDEFQPFDVQMNANLGVGYRFIKRPDLNLVGRLGAGAAREYGMVADQWKPEGLLGVNYDHQLVENQKLSVKVEYLPEWEDDRNYRLVTDIGWEVELMRPSNLSLKFAATDRYDSTTSGAKPHLINYSAMLLLKL